MNKQQFKSARSLYREAIKSCFFNCDRIARNQGVSPAKALSILTNEANASFSKEFGVDFSAFNKTTPRDLVVSMRVASKNEFPDYCFKEIKWN